MEIGILLSLPPRYRYRLPGEARICSKLSRILRCCRYSDTSSLMRQGNLTSRLRSLQMFNLLERIEKESACASACQGS